MAKHGLRTSFEMQTRDRYTKVDCELGLTVDGRELPNMEVLGGALEAAAKLIQERVTESYKVVPPRDAFEGKEQAGTPAPVAPVPQPAPVTPVAPVAQPAQVPQPVPVPDTEVVPIARPTFRDPRTTQ